MKDTNSMSQYKLNELPLWVKKLVCRFIGYYSHELHSFKLDSSNNLILEEVDKSKKFLCVIYARTEYTEETINYPIDSRKEVKKLLALEHGEHSNVSSLISSDEDGKKVVNLWKFSDSGPRSPVIIPESLLFAQNISEEQIAHKLTSNKATSLFIGRKGQLVYSLNSTPLVDSPERFCMSTGIASDKETKIISAKDAPSALVLGLKRTHPSLFTSFIRFSREKSQVPIFKKLSPIIVALFLYIGATSSYLVYKKSSLETELESNSASISSALKQQNMIDIRLKRYDNLKGFVSSQISHIQFWQLMSEVFDGSQITNVRIVDGRYIIRGNDEKATSLLERVTNYENVLDAKFDFPIRKVRGRELFVLSVNLSRDSNALEQPAITQ